MAKTFLLLQNEIVRLFRMKAIYFLTLLVFSSSLMATNRALEHEEAGKTFLNWHFFENGRGMTISPNMAKYLDALKQSTPRKDMNGVADIIKSRYGFETEGDKIMGVFRVKYKGLDVGVLGCTACHSGRAAGILIPGLGNKTIDAYLVSRDLKMIQQFWGLGAKDPEYKYIHEKAMNFANVTSDTNISNLTRGLISDATIETFFFKDIGKKYPKNLARAQVKVPHLWGIKEKRPVGIFNDGSLNGDNYAWIFGAELFASDSADHLRKVLPKIQWLTEEVLGKLLPPKYPFEIMEAMALEGEKLFKASCIKCHGQHDKDSKGFPIYDAPKHIPIGVVKTDDDKLKAFNQEFIDAVKSGSLGDLLTFNENILGNGFFAPKLWGIWSRFPYLHNASVPTLYDLLSAPDKRPEVFSMKDAGEAYRFDKKKLGLTTYKQRGRQLWAKARAKLGDRDIYYIERVGHSNKGHFFDSFESFTDRERFAIIEYLKTL